MDNFSKRDHFARSPMQRTERSNSQRKFLAAVLLASSHFLLSFSPSAIAQGRFDKVEITAQEVVSGIYMLQGAGGNIGVSTGKNGTFIIDDQFAPLSAKILAATETITDKPPSFVLNTHWHGDHSGGNENFSQAGATIVAHDNVRKRLISGRDGDEDYESAVPAALPVITFSEQITFHWNDHDIFIYHPDPAHTDGDSIVFFKDINVVHTGDVFFQGNYPFIDVASGGSLDGYIKAYNEMLEKIDDDTKIIPGHGRLSSKTDIVATRDMLLQVKEKIQKAIDRGLSEDETVKKNPLKKLSKTWGNGFINNERMTRLAYQALTK